MYTDRSSSPQLPIGTIAPVPAPAADAPAADDAAGDGEEDDDDEDDDDEDDVLGLAASAAACAAIVKYAGVGASSSPLPFCCSGM